MNIREIKALAAVLKQSELTVLEYCEGDTRIRLERAATAGAPTTPEERREPAPTTPVAPMETDNDYNNLNDVKAPMVGVYYASPAPDAPPFVKVGDSVQKGQVVCVIEAMKLMNDIVAPVSGRIVDVCVQDGAVLEFGQTIMKIV